MGHRILVTGGAGYVGSHCAKLLVSKGFHVTTLDNLSQGHAEAASGELVVADLRDRAAIHALMAEGFDAVLHFAARMSVGESVDDPLGYYDANVGGTLVLLDAMRTHGCSRLVFSSTCAVYGRPPVVPIAEDTPFAPISPYGETKAAVERILRDSRAAGILNSISLRYFNAAGASSDGSLGEAHDPETHLIPIALDAAATGSQMKIFGEDYPTRDGTCVRDYVHVEDLAEAHFLALNRLLQDLPGGAFNLGSGTGYTVKEVLDGVASVTNLPVDRIIAPRREGDPPSLVSDTRHTERTLGWTTQRTLKVILEDAWRWHQHPRFGPRAPTEEAP